ncbi:hypothetical protein LOZ65_003393 [Ophidiomyces ophidiicola]|nr:hypothetical protein LOZ65_003393 [Ophidiomyces ophidiicola]
MSKLPSATSSQSSISHDSLSSTNQFMDRLFYNYEKLMVDNVLLAQENMELCTANGKLQCKKKSTYVPQGGAARCIQRDDGMSSQETQEAGEDFVRRDADDPVQEEDLAPMPDESLVRKRAPKRCSLCRALDHTARTCPHRG